ncbi:MAG: DUF4340 domain-containing protein [Phycisphaerales bacterium]|nr:DUF4340 domain-containing protein [Phycisphaerales bacterium]
MNFRTTAVLLLLVLAVGAAWLFFPRGDGDTPPATATTPEDDTRYVLDPRPAADDITRVQVERPQRPVLVFERDAKADADSGRMSTWRIVTPLSANADGTKVVGLINTLLGLQSREVLRPGSTGGVTAEEAGLASPQATITLTSETGTQIALEIGRQVVLTNDTYVRVVGTDTIHVVRRDLSPQIRTELRDYRSNRLLDVRTEDIVGVRIEHEGRNYSLSRAEGEWRFNSPLTTYAQADRVRTQLLTPLTQLTAVDFVTDSVAEPERYQLHTPYLLVELTLAPDPSPDDEDAAPPPEARVVRLVAGGKADLDGRRRYVRAAGGTVALVDQAQLVGLIPNVDTLRESRLLRTAAANVRAIELEAGGIAARLERGSDGLWSGTGELAEFDAAAVQAFLAGCEQLRATSFEDEPAALADYGLDAPRATVRLFSNDRATPETLHVGATTPAGRHVYVQVVGNPAVAVVTDSQTAPLANGPLALRSRTIFTFLPGQLRNLSVERGGIVYELERSQDEEWRFLEPDGAPPDRTHVTTLVNDLSRLRAARVVARDATDTYGFKQVALSLRLRLAVSPAPGDESADPPPPAPYVEHVLRVATVDGMAYAQVNDDPHIYELDPTIYRVLTAELIETRLFSLPAGEITQIEIQTPTGTIDFVRRHNTWEFGPDPYVELNLQRLHELADTLAGLRVEHYLVYREANLATWELDAAPFRVRIRVADGHDFQLHLRPESPGELPRLAALVEENRIFRLSAADTERLIRGFDYYLAQPEAPAGPASGQP